MSNLLVLLRKVDVVLHVLLHPAQQIRTDGVPQHCGALIGRGDLGNNFFILKLFGEISSLT